MFENETYYYGTPVTTLEKHTRSTFLWMFIGLMVTAATAFTMAYTGWMLNLLLRVPMLSVVLLIAQIGVAIAFGARLTKMAPTTAKILFLAYAVILGITFSSLMYVYDLGAIFLAFGITAVYFGCLAFIGYTTKVDLMKLGSILMTGLLIFIIAEIILMFMGVDTTTKVFTGIGLILFTGITAYDTQKMKVLYQQYIHDENMLKKLSIYSAFDLYLDFINIFLYVLRLVGNRD